MEMLRVPPYNYPLVLEVSEPVASYDVVVQDMADNSIIFSGESFSTVNSKINIDLPLKYDNQYTITIDGDEEHIVDVVRPYVDPNTKGETASEIAAYRKNEEVARAIIDSIVTDGFYYRKKSYETTGLGADVLPIWKDIKEVISIHENNVLAFDAANPEDYQVQYELTKDKSGIHQKYYGAINRNESAPNILPAAGSDMLELNFVYKGFPRGFDYNIVGLFGYKKLPADIVRATEMLVEDIECGRLDYYKRYIVDYNTDQFKIKFDSGVFEGTGNIIVDKILSKYKKVISTIGVL